MTKPPWGGNPVKQLDHNGVVIVPGSTHQPLHESDGCTQAGHPTESISCNPNLVSIPFQQVSGSHSRRPSPAVMSSSRQASIESHSSVEPNHIHQAHSHQLVQYSSRCSSAEPQPMMYLQPRPVHQHSDQSSMDTQHPTHAQHSRHPSSQPEHLDNPQTSYCRGVSRSSYCTASPAPNTASSSGFLPLGPALQDQVIPEEGQFVMQPAKTGELFSFLMV